MSKICDRNYSGASMFSVKEINGVGCCPSCEKPVVCHGKSLEMRALFWALSGDCGISSESIANHMIGNPSRQRISPPSDASDRGRCIRLLELIPEWIPRLNEMLKYDQNAERGISISAAGISSYENSWGKQIPLILKEGRL